MEIIAAAIDKVLTDLASQPAPRWKTLAEDKQRKQIQAELNSSAPKDGMMRVITRMQFQEPPDLGKIDWESELATFEQIDPLIINGESYTYKNDFSGECLVYIATGYKKINYQF